MVIVQSYVQLPECIPNIWWWYVLVLYNKVTKSLPPRATFPWLTFRFADMSKVGQRWRPKWMVSRFKKWPDWWVPRWLNDLPSMFHWKKKTCRFSLLLLLGGLAQVLDLSSKLLFLKKRMSQFLGNRPTKKCRRNPQKICRIHQHN